MPKDEKIEEVEKKGGSKFLLFLLLALVLLAVGAGSTYFLAKTRPGLIGLPKNQAENQAEAAQTIAAVSKLITLPADETPTIATVTNIDQLKDQPFFKNARNGDKILVYQNANKAIIYRPEENRIIDVGAVNIASPVASGSPTATPKGAKTPTPTIEASPTATP